MTQAHDGVRLADLASGRAAGALETRPYWWRAAPLVDALSEPPAAKTDVLVVGAGFTGLSAALILARAGRQVTVVDAGAPGFGSSTRNGGQVGSGNQKFRVRTLVAMKGERKATELLREGVEMLDGLAEWIAAEKIDCDFRRCGRFRGAMRIDHYDAMARDMEDLRRVAGVDSAMIPRAEQQSEIGSDLFYGGSLLPQDASLHPGKYHAGLMARAVEAGVSVHGHRAVRAVRVEAPGAAVAFDGFQIAARDVLIAGNGYTRDVGAFFDRRIVRVGSAQIATAPIPAALFDRLTPTRRVYGNSNRVFFYFRPAPDEPRFIIGGRVAHLIADDKPGAYRHLARDLLRLFPELGDVGVTHGWTGLIGHTYDSFPHLGRTPEGVYFALGYCGTGVSRSTHFGRKIALQMLARREGASAFDDLGFPGHPLHALSQVGAPMVEMVLRARDGIGL